MVIRSTSFLFYFTWKICKRNEQKTYIKLCFLQCTTVFLHCPNRAFFAFGMPILTETDTASVTMKAYGRVVSCYF